MRLKGGLLKKLASFNFDHYFKNRSALYDISHREE